jgi:hypothetical protein
MTYENFKKMNRKAEKTVTLPNGWKVTIKSEKFLTTLKGGWETADETICGNDKEIIVRDKDGKIIADGGEIIEISPKSPVEIQRELGGKGCVAYLIGTRFGMREESYKIVKTAFDAVNAETDFPEYIEYLAIKAEEERRAELADAVKTVEAYQEAKKIIEGVK